MILIKNGTVIVGNGEIKNNTDILIKDNTIIKVDKNISANEEMEVIDAAGNMVMPGFIDTINSWGAKGPSWYDNDLCEFTDPINPHMDSIYGFDPDAMNFQRVYEYGVTSFGFSPSIYNVIGGKSTAFKTYGFNPYKMLIKKEVGMIASVTKSSKSKDKAPMTKMGIYALLKQALIDARDYDENGDYNAKNFELKKVIDKKMPLFINATTKADIDAINFMFKDFDIDIVITGSFEITDNLGEVLSRSKKIVLGDLTGGMLVENYNMDIDGINKLIKDGAVISISSCGDSSGGGKESLIWNGILYYKNGIPAEEVIKMLTLNAANILGIDDKVGSIEVGKDADIVIWSDNPITSFSARALHTFISGEDVLKNERRTSTW